MRPILCLPLLLALSVGVSTVRAAESAPDDPARLVRLLDAAADALNRAGHDALPEQRTGGGESLNQAFVALTGEAVNPLFGVTALGMYNYFRTPEELRGGLPVHDRPEVWIPLLIIILLMLFNSTICEAIPFLKAPLNAIGDMVNKAGAIAILPLAIKMFADSVAPYAGEAVSTATDAIAPAVHAVEGGVAPALRHSLGWAAGLVVGFVVYSAVWLAFNVIDVLIILCPFPGIDAVLKSFRLAVMGALPGAYALSPTLAAILAAVIVAISLLVAGWSFRLSVFGLVFSTDIIFFRRGRASRDGMTAFSAAGSRTRFGIPRRILGWLEKDGAGRLVFAYRPWLIWRTRRIAVGEPGDFSAGIGIISVFLVEKTGQNILRFPPRYRGMGARLAESLELAGTTNCGTGGSLRAWLTGLFGRSAGVSGEK